jgi:tripartite ATP-independent transporter DctM subunit
MGLFKALLGWLPGGYGVAVILILAFFTTFTGASGVTIMALGGLLSYILAENRYGDKFSLGLITASGSIGLLFPPSMPLILFGIIAQFILKDWVLAHPADAGMMQSFKIGNLFLAGVLPGLLMVLALGTMVVIRALRSGTPRHPVNLREAGRPLLSAIWEILLPVFVVALFLSGLITITEVAAISALYILIIEMFVHKDISFRDLAGIGRQTLVIVGGILIILAVSKGLAQYIIVEQIPDRIVAWMQAHVHSKFVFLLLLNAALLLAGCFLDIYSAIAVAAPIVIPVGLAYGVHPLHLGIIFLANLELGYLTPPVGLNLFMSAYRFEKPVGTIYRSIVPFFLLLAAMLLLITYIPFFSTALVNLPV